jgi:NADPH:quinone reductase-like Zn-dependent oxidoreductase
MRGNAKLNMRAAIFERQGLENLNVKDNVQQPTITDHDVLIKVKSARLSYSI